MGFAGQRGRYINQQLEESVLFIYCTNLVRIYETTEKETPNLVKKGGGGGRE